MTRAELKQKKLKNIENFKLKKDEYLKECFDTESPYFAEMEKIINNSIERGLKKEFGFELHHRIPRSFFKKKGIDVIDEDNLFKLTYQEHFLVHFYAYKCATKFLKPSMTLALMNMKRICTMNTNDVDTIKLSDIFDSIKVELYKTAKVESQVKYFKQNFKKIEENYGGKFELLRSTHFNSKSNEHTELDIKCRLCGKQYHIKSGSNFIKNKNFICECEKGYKESIDVLYFVIDYRYNKAKWLIKTLSYTPSMEKSGVCLRKNSREIVNFTWPAGPFDKISIIDIKPKGYEWKLDPSKKYDVSTEYSFIYDDKENFSIFKSKTDNSPESQRLNRDARLKKCIKIPTWMLEWAYTQRCKDPKFMERLIELSDRMYELNEGKDVKDFK